MNEHSIRILTLRYAATSVDKLAEQFVGNEQVDGSRNSVVYEQGIGMERASKMLNEMANIEERQYNVNSVV